VGLWERVVGEFEDGGEGGEAGGGGRSRCFRFFARWVVRGLEEKRGG